MTWYEDALFGLDLMDQIDLVAGDLWNNFFEYAYLLIFIGEYENFEGAAEDRHLKLRELLTETLKNQEIDWLSHGELVGKDHFLFYVIEHLFDCEELGPSPIRWFLDQVRVAPRDAFHVYWRHLVRTYPNKCFVF